MLSRAALGGASTCGDARYGIEVIAGGRRLVGEAWNALPESGFKSFVAAVSAHVLARRGVSAPCLASSGAPAALQLVFVHEALVASELDMRMQPGRAGRETQAGGARRLDSPWLQLVGGSAPGDELVAVFRWRERQFLRDQVALAGDTEGVPAGDGPIPAARFEALAQDYADTVLLAAVPEAKPAAQRAVAARIPADLLWLFRHAWQSTFTPFPAEARDALGRLIARAAPGYTALVQALFDQCAEPGALPCTYAGLGALPAGLVPASYRVDRLH